MKIRIFYLSFILFLFLMTGCSSITVVSDYDKSADFSKYSSFGFKKPDQLPAKYPTIINPINQRRIENAITEQMAMRNYIMTSQPDLLISYYIKVQERTDYRTTSYGGPWNTPYYGSDFYGWYYGYGHNWSDTRSIDYKEGTLIIDIVDARKNELVWYGAASKVLNESNPDPEKTINEAVRKIFYEYPYLAGQGERIKK